MTTTPPTIEYKRRRRSRDEENHYLLVDGRDVKVTLTKYGIIYVQFDYKAKADEIGPEFCTDAVGTIYRYSDREWVEKAGTFFYPYATEEESERFNAILHTVGDHTDLLEK